MHSLGLAFLLSGLLGVASPAEAKSLWLTRPAATTCSRPATPWETGDSEASRPRPPARAARSQPACRSTEWCTGRWGHRRNGDSLWFGGLFEGAVSARLGARIARCRREQRTLEPRSGPGAATSASDGAGRAADTDYGGPRATLRAATLLGTRGEGGGSGGPRARNAPRPACARARLVVARHFAAREAAGRGCGRRAWPPTGALTYYHVNIKCRYTSGPPSRLVLARRRRRP